MAHLTLDERGYIEFALMIGTPIAHIAKHLGRHRSTVYCEIKRNGYEMGPNAQVTDYPYIATNANNLAILRKQKTGSKSKFTKGLIEKITHYLKLKFFPEQIVHGVPNIKVSVGTIYNWIYNGILPFNKKIYASKEKDTRKRKEEAF